jgi:predicted ATPase/class 3 adenylate cyclase/Tfp pilus assembly protein PilF
MVDVVDSTGISDRLGRERALALWTSHDAMARHLIRYWGGREIDKTDGFLVYFDDVRRAASFALDYHKGLQSLEVQVEARGAIHSAAFDIVANATEEVAHGAKRVDISDWAVKAVVSRTLGLTRGGSTLVTAEAARVLEGEGFRIYAHGFWQLQGISEPIEIYELLIDNSSPVVPRNVEKAYRVVRVGDLWIPAAEIPHSLPAERDAFIGRASSLESIARRFRDGARVLSLLGVGGVGKTRVALRYSWQSLGDYPDGVWFCDLSAARTLDGVLFAVAQGLQLQLSASDPCEQIAAALAGRGATLVTLDNFEQVAEHAEATLGLWSSRASQTRFLVTTRETLGIVGEHALELSPLGNDEAELLFLRRIGDLGGDFDLTTADRSAIRQLVGMLDGLPLAIELAAARIRIMSPVTMLDRIDDRFSFLASRRGRKPRQATMRAALDWSWDLLSGRDRESLATLSIFEGSFTLSDAEAVLADPFVQNRSDVDDAIQSLVEKSLVRRNPLARFYLLRTVREYAAERLQSAEAFAGSGPAAKAGVESRHERHFSQFDEQAAIRDRCAAADDLVQCCRRAIALDHSGAAVCALTASWFVLRLMGPFRIALGLAQEVLALDGLSDNDNCTVLRILGSAQELLGEMDDAEHNFGKSLETARRCGNFEHEGWALCSLGEHTYRKGQTSRAREFLEGAWAIAARGDIASLQCSVLNALGALDSRLGRVEEARASYESALAIARSLNDLRREGGLLGNLAILAHDAGCWELARNQYEQALTLADLVSDRRWEGNTRCNLGLLLQERGNAEAATEQFRAALAIARGLGHAMLEATVLCNLGIAVAAAGRGEEARQHYQFAVEIAERLGDGRAEGQFRGYLAKALAESGQSTAALAEFERGEAALRHVEDSTSLCLLLCQRAQAECLAGDVDHAAQTRMRALSLAPGAAPVELQKALEELDRELGSARSQAI